MLAMTTKSNVGTGESLTEEERKPSSERFESAGDRTMPVPSGLSALIQAATSQLGILAEASSSESKLGSGRVISMTHSEDSVSCDSTEKSDAAPARTPIIVPEPDPRKQTFPELLMTLALDPSNIDVIAFLPDDKFFAIRTKDFSEDLMSQYFTVGTFVEFLDLSYDWGFTRIAKEDDDTCYGIEVFRHPCFIKGDWDKCTHIKFGETPTDARVSALPDRAKIEYTTSDDSVNSTAHSKRRLSPGFLSRRESETSTSSQKQKIGMSDLISGSSGARADSAAATDNNGAPPTSFTNISRTDDLRSMALSITTEKLNIKGDVKQNAEEAPLVDRAVESVTQTLVTDAIETLLKDERHTKETYLKHEDELSRSTLPGVVPISTQLFSPPRCSEPNSSAPTRTEAMRPTSSTPDADREAGRGNNLTLTGEAGRKHGCGSSTPINSK